MHSQLDERTHLGTSKIQKIFRPTHHPNGVFGSTLITKSKKYGEFLLSSPPPHNF
jgi:hypothetical protein